MARIEVRGMRMTAEIFGPRAETLPEQLARLAAETWESADCYRAGRMASLRRFMRGAASGAAQCIPALPEALPRSAARAVRCDCEDCRLARRVIDDYESMRETEAALRLLHSPVAREDESPRRGLARRAGESWQAADPFMAATVRQLRIEMLMLARDDEWQGHDSDCGCHDCHRAARAAGLYDCLAARVGCLHMARGLLAPTACPECLGPRSECECCGSSRYCRACNACTACDRRLAVK